MTDSRKTPFGELNRRAEQIAASIDTVALEHEIGEALEEAYKDGYDKGSDDSYDKGFVEGKAEGIKEAEEKFRAKEKVKFT